MIAPVVAENGGNKIAMTAPVMVIDQGDAQTIAFGMPRFQTLMTLPTPNDPRVKIVMIPTKKYAAKRFAWYRTDTRVKRRQEELLSLLARDGVAVQGGLAYAGYNAPWSPPWLTRNEVLVEIV